ncbi:hypothetical protein GCM10025875_10890 [Litorihabitans aurantiacus]|uniref:Uncharacterized protein n=1 Tax=Litorihabitans aurantiacus TaxID=1930061 RepID=A0AA37XDT9_9MICO|nr:hypothetical protein GCM10025875_10890 [Litorihabitans aurantiacus]
MSAAVRASDDGAGTPSLMETEAVRICRELIRIDSSNYGDGSGPGSAPPRST